MLSVSFSKSSALQLLKFLDPLQWGKWAELYTKPAHQHPLCLQNKGNVCFPHYKHNGTLCKGNLKVKAIHKNKARGWGILSLLCLPLVSYLRCSRAHNAAARPTVTDSFIIMVHPQVMAELVSHDGCKHLDTDPSKLHRSDTEGSQKRAYIDKVSVYLCAKETLLPFCLYIIRILSSTVPDFQPSAWNLFSNKSSQRNLSGTLPNDLHFPEQLQH